MRQAECHFHMPGNEANCLLLYVNHREVKIVPHWTGKITTVAQMFAIGWVMLRVTDISPVYPCAVAAVFTVWSSIAYIRQGQRILRGREA